VTTFTVHGNYGQLTAKVSTGVVIEYEPSKEGQTEYADIIRFDVEEYAAAYPGENLELIDVCDIGFWTTVGEYEPPVSEYRAEIASIRLEEQARHESDEAILATARNLATAGEWEGEPPARSGAGGRYNADATSAVIIDFAKYSHSSVI